MDSEWEIKINARRRKTLILKGLAKMGEQAVLTFLEESRLTTRSTVEKVVFQQRPSGRDLAFITFRSEDEMERCFRKKGKLAGTEVWIDRDWSPQERKKQWEEREARRKAQMGYVREHAAYPFNQQQRPASPAVGKHLTNHSGRATSPLSRRRSRE